MKRGLPFAVIALLFGAVALVACSGGDSGGGSGVEELVVINQNILHGITDEDPDAEPLDRFAERIELFADAVGEETPDVVFMQEVVGHPAPDYPDTRATVLGALGVGYSAVFGNFLGGPIEEDGLGQMTLTRLTITSSENRSVSAIRSVQHLALQTEHGIVDVYNAHLEGTGAVLETGEDAAVAEMDAVIAFIEETRGSGPVILAGDLNAEPDDPSIQRLIEAGFIDALAEAGDATCAKAGDPGCTGSRIPLGDNPDILADHRIDYVFVQSGSARGVKVKEAKLFLREPVDIGDGHTLHISDHIGLIVRLEIQSIEG
jgi:endonuclease/exonuclease/phosphatase family metal-dependent hydrolase